MDTDSIIIYIKTEDFYEDIADDVAKRFDTKNLDQNLRPKTYSYLMDDGSNDKKAVGTKKWVIKRRLKFNDYKDCLFKNEIILNHKKDLTVKHILYILKKLMRLH